MTATTEQQAMSRETRAMLLNVLWHHQGGGSNVGQPIRAILGIGEHDHLTDEQLAEAKWIEGLLSRSTRYENLIVAIEKSVKQNMSAWGEWVRGQIQEFRAAQGKDSAPT